MNKHSPEKYSEVLKSLHGVLSEKEIDVESLSLSNINENLAKEGVNINRMVSDVKSMIEKKRSNQRLETAKKRRLALENAAEFKKKIGGKTNIKEKLQQIINDLSQSDPKFASVYFRKLEEADEDDLDSILEDLMFLEGDDDGSK